MKRYKIAGCPKCQMIQTFESDKRLKCTYCGRTTKLKNSKGEFVIELFGSFDNPSVASEICTKFKGKWESKGKLKYEGDETWIKD